MPCPEGPAPWTRGGTASQIAPKLGLEGPSAPRPLRPRERGGVAPGSPGCRGVLGASAVTPAQAVVALAESVAIVWAATEAQGQIPSATTWWAGLEKGECQDASHHPVLQPRLCQPRVGSSELEGPGSGKAGGESLSPVGESRVPLEMAGRPRRGAGTAGEPGRRFGATMRPLGPWGEGQVWGGGC